MPQILAQLNAALVLQALMPLLTAHPSAHHVIQGPIMTSLDKLTASHAVQVTMQLKKALQDVMSAHAEPIQKMEQAALHAQPEVRQDQGQ